MANTGGFLEESIWRDKDFRALPRTAQATYAQLISQKELDRAGLIPLQITKWAKACDSMSVDDLWADLKVLQTARFVCIDEDTDELLVRSYMRRSNVIKQPNLLKNALKCAGMAASEWLRHELAVELRRMGRKDTVAVADEIDPNEGFDNPSERVSEPIDNPSTTHPEPLNPSGTHREPRGEGEGEGEEVTSGGLRVGGSRAHVHAREAEPTHPEPPNPRCPQHLHDDYPPACGACADARRHRERFDAEQALANVQARRRELETLAAATAAEIAACDLCDDRGYIGTRVCDHDPTAAERNRRGAAMARAALAKGRDS